MAGWEGRGVPCVVIGLVEVARASGRPEMEGGLEVTAWVVRRDLRSRARILELPGFQFKGCQFKGILRGSSNLLLVHNSLFIYRNKRKICANI